MIRHEYIIDRPFEFEAGGVLEGVKIVYHTSKPSYNGSDKVVVICHALTANSDPEEWWDTLVGPGKFFDTEKYFIFCVNMLGSPYGSSGPIEMPEQVGHDGEDEHNDTPRHARPRSGIWNPFGFPLVTVRDMVNASIEVRKHLGINKIDLLIGSSIGGFQAVEWAVMEPDIFKKVVFMATGARVSPWISASMEAQRMALEADPSFRKCQSGLDGGKEGLKCARAQALMTYRSYEGYQLTQAEKDEDTLFAGRAASYEQYQGKKLADRFDAYSYYYLTKSVDSHNVGRGRGGLAKALGRITADTTAVFIDSDGLFPPSHMREWARMIPGVTIKEISSDFGHDGFLLETEQIVNIIKPLLTVCK